MKRSRRNVRLLARVASCLIASGTLAAQEAGSLDALAAASRSAIEAGDWQRALDLNTRAVTEFGSGHPLETYGPQFGAIFYQKGLCELKLKQWKAAAASFETCYRDFPNPPGARENLNPFAKLALLKAGEAAMGDGEWLAAVDRFTKFAAERDPARDTFPAGSFHLNLAVCHYRLGQLAPGNENLEIAIRNKAGFPTPENGIVAGFEALVAAALAKRDEQVLLDFIAKNRGGLTVAPEVMHRYAAVFLKLGADAADAGMRRAALAIFQFVPSTDDAIDNLRARLRAMGPSDLLPDGGNGEDRVTLETELAALEAVRRGRQPPEAIRLAAVASLHEQAGNPTGAWAAWRELESHYPNAENRRGNLFNLIRLSAAIRRDADLASHADTFARTFPDAPELPEVRRLLLDSLMAKGDHRACIGIAKPIAEKAGAADAETDHAMYLLGACYFQMGEREPARQWLARHAERFPASPDALQRDYFQAANEVAIDPGPQAAALLDRFLADHPAPDTNPWLAEALYQRALCHEALGEPAAALACLDRLLRELPRTPLADAGHLLRARLLERLGEPAQAETAYQAALDAAAASADKPAGAAALTGLVRLIGAGGSAARRKQALGYVDRFWKEHGGDTAGRNRMAMAEVPVMAATGRTDAALDRLKTAISTESGVRDSEDLRPLVDTHAALFLTRHGPEALERLYDAFPGVDAGNQTARASLAMAVIGAYERRSEAGGDEATEAKIKTLFQQFKTRFPIEVLAGRDLLRLGDFLHLKTSAPREAIAYYDEVIRRGNPRLEAAALLGRGDVRSHSELAADLQAALADFQTVYQKSGDRRERDYAMFRIIGLRLRTGDIRKASEEAAFYLDRPHSGFSGFIPQVLAYAGQAAEADGRIPDAIATYERLWRGHADDRVLSANAMSRWMQLSWNENAAARSEVCDATAEYLRSTAGAQGSENPARREVEELLAGFRKNLAQPRLR